MGTKYKESATLPQKVVFWTYTTSVNGTAIGWGAAGMIAAKTMLDIDAERTIRQGSAMLLAYFVPASVVLNWVTSADRYYCMGKTALGYGSKWYKVGKFCTSPVAAINYFGGKLLTTSGLTEGMKLACGVEECDDFYWQMPQHSEL